MGHVVVNPWRGVAGIYAMGVADAQRRRGIGRALVIAACRRAIDARLHAAVLNATEQGEPVYRGVGFESLGHGQTWWLARGPAPTARMAALALAIGAGDRGALDALEPSPEELAASIAGDTGAVRLAILTGHGELVEWMLDRAPALTAGSASRPTAGRCCTWPWKRAIRTWSGLALARGVDPAAARPRLRRDRPRLGRAFRPG